jgi:hypothetical protein
MMQKHQRNEHALRLYNLYIAGLMALILVVLQAVLGLDKTDVWVKISVDAFSIAVPLLGGVLVVNLVEELYPYGRKHSASARGLNIIFFLGIFSTLIGMDAAFWHISWLAGILFIVALVVAMIVCGWYVSDLDDKSGKPDED